jgi:hypothetical protein
VVAEDAGSWLGVYVELYYELRLKAQEGNKDTQSEITKSELRRWLKEFTPATWQVVQNP